VFPPLPSLLHNYQFAIGYKDVSGLVIFTLVPCVHPHPPAYQILTSSSLISLEIWSSKIKKVGAAYTTDVPTEKFIHIAVCKCQPDTKFKLPSLIVSKIWRGSQNINWGLLISPGASSGQIYACGPSICKCHPAHQVSTSYLD